VKTIARLARRRRFEIANSVLPDEVAKASQNGYVNKKSMVWTHLSGTWVFGGQQFPDRSPLRRGCDTGWPFACAKPPHSFQEDPWYCHQLGNWTKGQGEEKGEPGDAHRRLTLDSLLIGKIAHARREWEALSATLALKEYGTGSRQEFMRNCREGMYDDVVAVYRSNASTSVSEGSFRVDRGFGMGWDGREGRADICGR
jgi:hypothetical protein